MLGSEDVNITLTLTLTLYRLVVLGSEDANTILTLTLTLHRLMVLGSEDANIPYQVTIGVQRWANKTVVLGGAGHEIQSAHPAANNTARVGHSYLPELESFVREAVGVATARGNAARV